MSFTMFLFPEISETYLEKEREEAKIHKGDNSYVSGTHKIANIQPH